MSAFAAPAFSCLLSPRFWAHLLLVRPVVRLLFGLDVEGRENLAGLGQFILAANHNSHLDAPVLLALLPARRAMSTHPVAAEEYFSRRPFVHRLSGFLFRPCWIERGSPPERSLERMRGLLEAGGSLIVFPEGTRGEPGRIGRFHTGIARLAETVPGVPIVPVFLAGPERALPRSSRLPLPFWNHVTIGPPQRFTGSRVSFTQALERKIRELAGSEAARRQRRERRARRPRTLAVLGIDGSGKSTLSLTLARDLSETGRVCRISDRLEFFEGGTEEALQPLPAERARRTLGRAAKSARSLERYKIPKLAEMLLRDALIGEVRRYYGPDLVVLDGSPLLNMLAWMRLYRPETSGAGMLAAAAHLASGGRPRGDGDRRALRALPELAALRRLGLAGLRVPDALVLLDADPSQALERIRRRGDPLQPHETAERLASLRGGYHAVVEMARTELALPALVIDGRRAPEEAAAEAMGFVRSVWMLAAPETAHGGVHDPTKG